MEDVVKPIMLLSIFFSQLTAKTLRKTDIFQLRHDIVQVLCKFEMIFPPAFFTSMMHVMVHLPEEALLAGPVNYRWMYPIERLLGELKKSVRNRMWRRLSIVLSAITTEVAHWFVLNNCDEIMAYLDEHEEMMKREHPSHLVAQKQRELFPQWFLDSVNKLKSSNSPTYSDELYNLAFGPIRAELFSGCYINALNFWGLHEMTSCVRKTAVSMSQVEAKCRWFDSNPNRPGSVKIDHGLLSVNINRTWYDDDPYILANMATQIVYLDDPKAGSSWKVVQKMDHRNVYAIPELDPTDNDVDNVADQRLESSMENDAETLRDTHSITIDLGDLPRFDVAVGPSSEDDVVIVEEEEEDWETESDDSDDNENVQTLCNTNV
ncbi:hypothetical protein Prudu_006071 [Prunus dulcis]|uniref:Transposable element protein n=1 Tax=Prunus dulcis TaxID=3755 RepID=A0A4Y1QZ12_PRUDU|nr:hypothetical protein Prudu_006071 [Prunus dulcis]